MQPFRNPPIKTQEKIVPQKFVHKKNHQGQKSFMLDGKCQHSHSWVPGLPWVDIWDHPSKPAPVPTLPLDYPRYSPRLTGKRGSLLLCYIEGVVVVISYWLIRFANIHKISTSDATGDSSRYFEGKNFNVALR